MNRPQPIAYAFGNPVSALCIYGFTALVGYEMIQQQAPFIFFAICLLVSAFASKWGKEIQAYRLWKMEWDHMGGETTPSFLADRPRLRELVYFAVFVTSGFITGGFVDYETAEKIGYFMGVAFYVFLARWIVLWWLSRRKPYESPVQAIKNPSVSVCLSVPTSSPEPQQVFAALPPYCKYLLLKKSNA